MLRSLATPFLELCVVIPDFNGWDQTRLCLNALLPQLPAYSSVIVVDHGTTDNTAKGIAKNYPSVIRLLGSESLWWAGASNVGIRYALQHKARLVMLLNNDCYLQPCTISALLRECPEGVQHIVSATQINSTSQRVLNQHARSCLLLGFPTLNLPLPLRHSTETLLSVDLTMGGRGAIIPTTVFQKIGLLDEVTLPHYWADHDFYLRCKKAGIKQYLVKDAIIIVDDTRTTVARHLERKNWQEFKNTLYDLRSHRNVSYLIAMFQKHYPIPGLNILGVALNLLRYLIIYLIARIHYKVRIFDQYFSKINKRKKHKN